MAVVTGTTTTQQFDATLVKEIDFIERFNRNWESLREIMGIMRPIRKTMGTRLAASVATVTLNTTQVNEGDEVGLSQVEVKPVTFTDLTLEKFRTRVTAEAVEKFGAAVAVQKTDDAFINELQGVVLDRFFTFAKTGQLVGQESDFQMAVSMAISMVKDKFKRMRRDYTNIVVFVNTLDVGRYLGSANITIQTQNGVEYFKNFLGAETVIVSSEVDEGSVIAIPAENIVLYYVDPADGDFAELGLEYTTGNGETNLIGVHKEGVYGRASGDTHAIMGMVLFAEYIDAIANVTFGDQSE